MYVEPLERIEILMSQLPEEDGRALLLRHREGDSEAFGYLVQKYRRQVYSYLLRCGVPASNRDDMFQEIFLKVHSNSLSYNAERKLEPWLFTIVANTTRSYFRSAIRQEPRNQELFDTPSNSSSAQETSEALETQRWLEQQIAQLPLEQREALVLCCFDDLKQTEAAEALDIPLNTLKTRLRRAKATLAAALEMRASAQELSYHG
jgi:RNA polymerase sigma-70 factor (ECF subfamily)